MSAGTMAPRDVSPALGTLPPLRPSTVPTPADLTARRAGAGAARTPVDVPGVTVAGVRYGDVPCVVCEPADPRGVLVYFHGGGYRLGSAAQFTAFAARLADATGARVVAVDYRLAPEHPYPAALHDAVTVYERVLAESAYAPVLIGDSAGGGLAAALTVACTGAGLALPGGVVLISAWLDLRCTAESYRSRASTDRLFSYDAARQAAHQYLQGHQPDDPLVSPLFADLSVFPPTLLLASTDEVLLDDTLAMSTCLTEAGVTNTTHIEPGVPHAWPGIFPDLPESAAAVEMIGRFVAAYGTSAPAMDARGADTKGRNT
ncbi:alpha/beta hydrolase [Yinghuangia sp. ASG 101]|uniref:alpha/beta hydrolase n=1 Tax=Yinghuangia sp. ASG 101 TaxID=2896848 RepID=UPI001E657364|nr:alpha/beta hydrolase [Yinghuangia sp. ASG 101]UGQ12241.1 alpha/beta hydrolase [Yinghuangia sp. ASG 101]